MHKYKVFTSNKEVHLNTTKLNEKRINLLMSHTCELDREKTSSQYARAAKDQLTQYDAESDRGLCCPRFAIEDILMRPTILNQRIG